MTNRATLESLLARVLECTGPDRELDAEIGAAFRALPSSAVGLGVVGWLQRWEGPFVTDPSLPGHILTENRINWKAPPYTESLDAALTLVPEGGDWARNPGADKILVSLSIDIPLPDGTFKSEWISQAHTDDKRALIAACIKARMEAQPLSNP
jgi:hypothetical protein